MSRYVLSENTCRRYFNTLRLDLRLVRALAASGRVIIHSASSTAACGSQQRPTRRLWGDWVVLNDSNFGVQWDKNHPQMNGCTSLADSCSSWQKWGTLLTRCMRASGAPDDIPRQPETTHEVFSWTRSCEPAPQKLAKSLSISFHAREPQYYATSPMKKRLSLILLVSRRLFWSTVIILSWCTRQSADREISFPSKVLSYWAQKKGKKGKKKR